MKPGLRREIAIYALIAAVYGGVLHGAVTLSVHYGASVAFWPAAGVALALVLRFGPRYWPAFFLGAVLISPFEHFRFPLGSALVAANVGEALLGAWILRRYTSFENSLRRLSDVLNLFVVTILVVPHVRTMGVSLVMCAGGMEPWSGFVSRWLMRWLGGATSVLVVVPWVLAGKPRRFLTGMTWKRKVEAFAVSAGLLAAGIMFYGGGELQRANWPVGFLIYPLSIWVAFRFGLGGVTWLNLLAGSFVIWGTMNGRGLYAQYGEATGMALAAAFVAVISGTDLLLSAILAERKAIAENFSASEKRYRELVERSPTLICTHALDGTLLSVNGAALEALGYRPEEMVGRNLAQLVAAPVRGEFADYLKRIGERGADNGVLRLVTRDGRDRYLLYRNSVLREPGREPFVLGNAVDITDRLEAKELLKRSEGRYRRVVDHIREGLLVDDTEGRVVYANAEFLQLFGLSAEDLSAMTLEDYIAPEWRALLRDRHNRRVRGEKVPDIFEYEGLRKDGTRIWLEVAVTPVVENGVITGTQSVIRDISERKQAHERIEYQAKMLASVKDAVLAADQDFRITTWNPGAEAIFGWEAKELLGRTVAELLGPDFLDVNRPEILQELAAKGSVQGELTVRRRDGAALIVETSAITVRDEQGDVSGYVSVTRDITERKRAEEEARSSTERLTHILESITDGFFALDEKWRFVYINKQGARLIRRSKEELLGRNIWEAFPEVSGWKFEKELRRAMEEEAAVHFEGYHPAMGRWFALHAYPSPGGLSVFFADISEGKRSAEALRESETRYRDMVENATYGIFRATAEGDLLDVNAALGTILGYGFKEDLLNRNVIRDFFLEPAEGAAILETALQTGRLEAREALWRRKDGTAVAVHLAGRMARDAAGQPAVIEAIVENVTERRSLEEQLRQAQKMEAVGQLAGGVAHDFNNLLGVIIGYSEVILDRKRIDDRMRGQLEQVRRAGNSAASLTRQLLAFSRKQALEPRIIDLNILVSDTSRMLQRLIGEHVKLVIVSGAGLGRVKVAPGQMEQVIMNLAVNARDAMPDGGRLTIETSNAILDLNYAQSHVGVVPGPYVLLTVSDSGMGMPPETVSRIFEPFFTTKKQGTGLGLATVYGIIQQSGGHLWVYSEVGHGTSFKIYLPRIQDEGAVTEEEEAEARPPRGTETVLLVEDAEHLRLVVREFLHRLGYTVVEAEGGEEALKLAHKYKGPIHLLLSDVVMPEMSGRHLWEKMRELRPGSKVLFMSGYTDDAIVHHGILEGGMSLLSKPFTQMALARKIREVLDGGKK
ncbi:MAG: PAS domain S-box protein [Acidobacteriia bacterium]|nr:PAS domain S-box protein [Terriglobia bacterium]